MSKIMFIFCLYLNICFEKPGPLSLSTEQSSLRILYYKFSKFENGSNLIVTLINHLLEEFVSDHEFLPKKLHLNLGKPLRINHFIVKNCA